MEMHTSCFFSFRLCMRDGDKRRQAKAYSLCGWKLSFQLARHPVIRSIHLSGLSLVATLRARSLSAFSLSLAYNCSVIQTPVSRSLSPFCLPPRRPETQRQTLPCYSPLTVFTSSKLTQTWQGDMRSCLGPEPSSNCHLHHTHINTHAKENKANCSCGFRTHRRCHGCAFQTD